MKLGAFKYMINYYDYHITSVRILEAVSDIFDLKT